MNLSNKLTEDDLKEIFSLFTSPSKSERDQVYDRNSGHYFLDVNSFHEHTLTEEKRDYALDAWRAVIYFLYSKGYSLCKDGERTDLSFIEDDFMRYAVSISPHRRGAAEP